MPRVIQGPIGPRTIGRLVCVCLLTLLPARALAQGCTDQAAPATNTAQAFVKLALLDSNGCLGGAGDRSALAKAVNLALQAKPAIAAHTTIRDPFAEAIALLRAYAVEKSAAGTVAIFVELDTKLGETEDALGTFTAPAVPTFWEITQGTVPAIAGSLQERVGSACQTAGPACTAAFDTVREAMRIAGLTKKVLNGEASPVFQASLTETTRRLRQWGEYFDTARSQYPWELLVNGKVMGDSRERNAAGVAQGFRRVPSSQVILLHPTIAFEYDRGEPQGDRLTAAAIVDVIGFNKWAWAADGGMGRAIGASLVASIGDKASGQTVGWGAMVHVNHKYSAGFTIRRGAKAFVVSADVPKLWNRVPQAVRERVAGGR